MVVPILLDALLSISARACGGDFITIVLFDASGTRLSAQTLERWHAEDNVHKDPINCTQPACSSWVLPLAQQPAQKFAVIAITQRDRNPACFNWSAGSFEISAGEKTDRVVTEYTESVCK